MLRVVSAGFPVVLAIAALGLTGGWQRANAPSPVRIHLYSQLGGPTGGTDLNIYTNVLASH